MTHILAATRDLFRRLLRREDGNVIVMLGMAAFTIVIGIGMAVDVVRAYTVKVQLGQALDAAGLAVASSANLNSTQQTARLNKFFYGNFPQNIGVATSLNMTPDTTNPNAINLTASANVPPIFMELVGFGAINVAASAQVTKEPTGLEVAFVLDNTGSMWSNNNIDALKNDTLSVINILFGANTTNDKLKMSIVPFVTAVNVGDLAPTVTDDVLPKDSNNVSVSYNQTDATKWKGCVEEPDAPYDQLDTTKPGDGAAPWKPYWWPSDVSTTVSSGPHLNPWGPGTTNIIVDNTVNDTHLSHSPNLSCPTPLTRLTSDKQTLLDAANAMTAWDRSGTMIHVGAAWGWRTISPDSVFQTAGVPDALPYNTPGWKKAIIIESDGVNNFNYAGTNCKDLNGNRVTVTTTKNGITTATTVPCATPDYTAFGYLADARLAPAPTNPTDVTAAVAELENRLTNVCDNIKAKGIIVYAIGFGTTVSPALSGCAGNGGKYFLAPDQATLQSTFQQIATELNAIRLSK